MSGKRSQAKGRRAELELCSRLHYEGFEQVEVAPPQNYGKVPDLIGLEGIHIECKRHERLQLPAWLFQAEQDSKRFNDGLPVVIHRSNRGRWIVSMYLPEWLELYKRGLDQE